MLINSEEINKILVKAESNVINKGKRYFELGRVKIASFDFEDEKNYVANSYIESSSVYEICVSKEDGKLSYSCNCPSSRNGAICIHIIAVIFNMYVNPNDYFNFKKKNEIEKYRCIKKLSEIKTLSNSKGIIGYYENLELDDKKSGKIEILPLLSITDFREKNLEISFKLGINKKYIIKDIYEFSKNVLNENIIKYGKELEFKHSTSNFTDNSQNLLRFIINKTSEYTDFINLSYYPLSFNLNKRDRRTVLLKYSVLDEFFDLMLQKEVEIDKYSTAHISFLEENPKFDFNVSDDVDEITITYLGKNEYYLFYGEKYTYVLYGKILYRCDEEFNKKMIPFLKDISKRNGTLYVNKEEATSFCEYLIPFLKEYSNITLPNNLLEKYKAEKLGVKVYLDIEKNRDITADIKFCYGDSEFNPLDKNISCNYNRNVLEEKKAKVLFEKYKFIPDYLKKVAYLSNEDDIYDFLTDGINIFMQKFEVLVTDRLINKQIRTPKMITMGIRIKNEFLEINFDDLGVDETELKEIFKRYKLKKKYYRLKDGSFINIASSEIDTLANISESLNLSESDIIKGNIRLPKYRAIYLDNIVKQNKSINVEKESSFKEMVRNITDIDETDFEIPANLQAVLRVYQKRGFKWLKTLDKYKFGGILADDMGLGKTIQVIALLSDEKTKTGKTSFVVCPSSLYINWKKEINKFAPKLKTLVISGSADKREKNIKKIEEYDVVITSYDLLKRDVDMYKNYTFKYIIADEAQYIKNNKTKNAKALKELNSEVRFALTGTPIENSLAELWSIFDFIMPGYLFSYKKFKENYEIPIIRDEESVVVEKLQKLVAPFILRRTKDEVLKELPDKTETIMYSEMESTQKKLYRAYLVNSRKELSSEIDENGFEKSKFKILSAITRLRQICCHPSLFIESYDGSSAKLEQCIELIEGAISAGHKILLFSGFTSMFDIIQSELNKRNIKYSVLTGKTKVDTRIEMVDEFNTNESIKVFLISLKAGGTGLNLTGADIVIHYDPWWNLSAENQATDRAYRIGQKNNVQVFKLITSDSIEEKIQKLQEKKSNLSDHIIKNGEMFINKMSKEDIMELFME